MFSGGERIGEAPRLRSKSEAERGDTMARTTPLVTRSRDRAWGATVFAGTRVPVDTMYEYLEAADTLDEFLRQFPTVTREQAVAVLESAKQRTAAAAIPG